MQDVLDFLSGCYDWTVWAVKYALLWCVATSTLIGVYACYVFVQVNYRGQEWQIVTPQYPAPPQRIDWGTHDSYQPGDLPAERKRK